MRRPILILQVFQVCSYPANVSGMTMLIMRQTGLEIAPFAVRIVSKRSRFAIG